MNFIMEEDTTFEEINFEFVKSIISKEDCLNVLL